MKIIVLDDEPLIAHTLVDILRGEGHDAASASNGKSALALAVKLMPDLVVSDVIMPGKNGIEVAKEILKRAPNCRIILLSGQASSRGILDGARADGYSFELLAKPVSPGVLLSAINREPANPSEP